MINIAVCCRGSKHKSAEVQFEDFIISTQLLTPVSGTLYQASVIRIGAINFFRVTTSLDIRGCTFDGVIRLSELAPEVEQELIACMRPAIPL